MGNLYQQQMLLTVVKENLFYLLCCFCCEFYKRPQGGLDFNNYVSTCILWDMYLFVLHKNFSSKESQKSKIYNAE